MAYFGKDRSGQYFYQGSGDGTAMGQSIASTYPYPSHEVALIIGNSRESAGMFKTNIKVIDISGPPMQLTIECDYKTININGMCHRLYIIGICNKVNLSGDLHSIYFDGFSNEVNFMSRSPAGQGKCAVWGDEISLNCKLGFTNGTFIVNKGPKPEKLTFPDVVKEGRRHRFTWKPAMLFTSDRFLDQTPPPPPVKAEEITEEVEWEDSGCQKDQGTV